MFHVKRHIEIKNFSDTKWLKKTSRRQLRSSWLSSAERVIPHSVGKCPEGTKGQGIL